MMNTQLSSREANQNFARAKRAARLGPVFITDRGQDGHVLLTRAEYDRIIKKRTSLAEALSNPEVAVINFELPPRRIDAPREIDFD